MGTSNERVALVTGGAVGIGRAIAERLAVDGIVVAIGHHARSPDEVIASIEGAGGQALATPFDVTDRSSVERAMSVIVERLGGLDILVNNAGGLLGRVPIATMADDHWQEVLSVNLTSAFVCIRAALPHLRDGGRIVNVSSAAAQTGGGPGAAAYAAAKAGILGLTRAAAKELGERGITVNAVTPGFIAGTPFHETFSPPAAQQAMVAASVLQRAGQPTDVAGVVAFLASVDASFVTGAIIDVNGGSSFS